MTPMEQRMIPVYVLLVQAGRRTLDEVPEAIRAEVEEKIGTKS